MKNRTSQPQDLSKPRPFEPPGARKQNQNIYDDRQDTSRYEANRHEASHNAEEESEDEDEEGGGRDARIRSSILEQLLRDPAMDASEIDIDVNEGAVTFSGRVTDKWMKFEAEDVAEKVYGVREVRNEIRVIRDGLERHEKI
jgi:osmotically-inducible protein OsmY